MSIIGSEPLTDLELDDIEFAGKGTAILLGLYAGLQAEENKNPRNDQAILRIREKISVVTSFMTNLANAKSGFNPTEFAAEFAAAAELVPDFDWDSGRIFDRQNFLKKLAEDGIKNHEAKIFDANNQPISAEEFSQISHKNGRCIEFGDSAKTQQFAQGLKEIYESLRRLGLRVSVEEKIENGATAYCYGIKFPASYKEKNRDVMLLTSSEILALVQCQRQENQMSPEERAKLGEEKILTEFVGNHDVANLHRANFSRRLHEAPPSHLETKGSVASRFASSSAKLGPEIF